MAKKNQPSSAWDDDWESAADRAEEQAAQEPEPVKVSKSERLALHAEQNRKLWQSADTPDTFHFLAARDTVPLKTEFKPALKVLSRQPAPKVIARQDPATGLSQMTIEDDEDDEDTSKNQPTPEELRAKAQRDREEKLRKYEEVRAKLFGPSDAGSGSSSPGNLTPPREEGVRGKGKGRGRGGRQNDNRRLDPKPAPKELYDPNYTPRPGAVSGQSRGGTQSSRSGSSTRNEEQPIRAPRGPDTAGRGFGFADRGGKHG